MTNLQSRFAAACLALAGATPQARAEGACLTPEHLPATVDGIAVIEQTPALSHWGKFEHRRHYPLHPA